MSNDIEKRISAKYILDSSGFNSGLQGINSNLKQNKAQLDLATQGIKSFGTTSNGLKGVQAELGKQFDLQSKKVDLYKQSLEKTNTKMQENISRRDKLKTSLDMEKAKLEAVVKQYGTNSEVATNLKGKIAILSEEYNKKSKAVENNAKSMNNSTVNMNKAQIEMVKTEGKLKSLSKEILENDSKWLKVSSSMDKYGDKLQTAGHKISGAGDKVLTATAPLIIAGIASGKFAREYETALAKVSTISDDTQVPIAELGNQMIQLSNDTGIAVGDITNASYEALSAGQNTSDAVNFVANATKLAKAGFAETEGTIDLLTTVLNSYGIEASEVGRVSDILIDTQNRGKVTVKELSAEMGKIIPTAKASGVSYRATWYWICNNDFKRYKVSRKYNIYE